MEVLRKKKTSKIKCTIEGPQCFFFGFVFKFRPIFKHPDGQLLTTDMSNWPKVSLVYLNPLFCTLLPAFKAPADATTVCQCAQCSRQ